MALLFWLLFVACFESGTGQPTDNATCSELCLSSSPDGDAMAVCADTMQTHIMNSSTAGSMDCTCVQLASNVTSLDCGVDPGCPFDVYNWTAGACMETNTSCGCTCWLAPEGKTNTLACRNNTSGVDRWQNCVTILCRNVTWFCTEHYAPLCTQHHSENSTDNTTSCHEFCIVRSSDSADGEAMAVCADDLQIDNTSSSVPASVDCACVQIYPNFTSLECRIDSGCPQPVYKKTSGACVDTDTSCGCTCWMASDGGGHASVDCGNNCTAILCGNTTWFCTNHYVPRCLPVGKPESQPAGLQEDEIAVIVIATLVGVMALALVAVFIFIFISWCCRLNKMPTERKEPISTQTAPTIDQANGEEISRRPENKDDIIEIHSTAHAARVPHVRLVSQLPVYTTPVAGLTEAKTKL